MKSKSAFGLVRTGSPAAFILAGALAALLATPAARAAVLYWDTNGTTTVPPFGNGASSSGTWGADGWWSLSSSGPFADGGRLTTTALDNLVITASGNTAGGSPTTLITVSGNQFASSIYGAAGNNSNDQAAITGGTISLYSTVSGATTSAICGTGDYQLAIGSALVLEQATGSNVYIGGTETGGNGGVTISGGITSTNSGLNLVLQTNHGLTIAGSALNFQGSLTSIKTNNFTIGSNIGSNVTTVTQNGVGGTMNLTGTNTYTGTTTISAGTLAFGSTAAIGGSGASVIVNPNGAVVLTGAAGPAAMLSRIATTSTGTIALDTDSSAAIDFNAAGFTAASLGAAINNVSYTGLLTPNGTTYRLGGGGKVLTLSGTNALTGSGNSLVITGAAAGSGVVLADANDYTGTTTVNSGTLTVSGTIGAIASSASTSIRGGSLILDNTAGIVNRLKDDGAVTTSGTGTFSLIGNAATDTTETIGTLGIASGPSVISVASAAGRVTTLAASAFSRANNATALVRGTLLNQTAATAVSRITLADGGASLSLVGTNTLNNGGTADATKDLKIVPYLFGEIDTTNTGSNFVTYDTTLGLRVLTAAEQTTLAAGSTTVVAGPVNAIAFNGTVTAATGITVNSLLFTGAQALNSSGASTPALTVNSGAIALVANNAASIGAGFTGGLTLGNGEGVITVKQNALTINAPISVTGGGGLTKAGAGTLVLGAASNSYSGGTFLNAGTLQVTTPAAFTSGTVALLGAGAVNITTGGTLSFQPGAQGKFTISNPLNLTGNGGVIGLSFRANDTSYRLTGPITTSGSGPTTLLLSTGLSNNGDRESVTFDSAIPDNGGPLTLQVLFTTQSGSQSYVNLNGGGSFTGPINLVKGNNVTSGYLTIGGVFYANNVEGTINTPGTGQLGGGTFANAISLDAATILNFNTTANQSLTGLITGAGSLMNSASGTLTLTNANTFSGTTTVTGGKVVMGNALALQNSAYNTTGSTGGIGLDMTGHITPILGGLSGNVALATAITGYGSVTALTLNPQAGVSVTYSGNLDDNGNTMPLTKIGPGTQNLSGANAYTGGTNVNFGTLTYLNTNAKPSSGTTTVAADATLGLGVAGASAFTSTDVTDLFAGTLSNVTNSATSYVGIDTTNGNFTYADSVPATTRGLVKLGANILTLTGNSTYNGLTLMTGGTLTLNGTNAGNGGLNLSAGTLNINNAGALGTGVFTIGANTTIGNTGVPLNVNSTNTPQVWNGNFTTSGIVNLGTGAVSLNATPTLSIGAPSTLIVGGVISGAFGLTKQSGGGVLELTGANIYTGNTSLNASGGAGILRVSGTGTLGTGNVTVNNIGILDITSSAVQNVGTVTMGGGWILGGTINSTSTSATAYSGNGYISSNLQGAGAGLTAASPLGLFLSGTNSYGGATTVGAGMLVPIKPAALPNSGASGTITLNNAASLLALRTGTGQWDAAAIGNLMSNAGFTLTVAGAAVAIDTAAGDFTYGSALPATTNLALTKMGPNNLTLTAANLYPAKTTINRGTITLAGATGSLAATSALTFTGTGKFNYDNVGAGAGISQTLGALTFSAGEGTIQLTRTAAQSVGLTFGSLAARTAGATGNFVLGGTPGTNGTDSKISFTTAPTASAFINQGVFFGGSAYAAYDSGGFLRALNYATDTGGASVGSSFATFTAAGANGKHVNLDTSGSITGAGTESINSLRIGANGTNAVTLAGGSTLTIASGGILKTGGNATTISGGTGISGSAELVIRTDLSSDVLSLSTPILGNTVTKTGAGTLELSGSNTFTALRINQGQLNINSNTAIPAGATLTLNEGTTLDNTTGSTVSLTGANLNVNINGSFTYLGTGGKDLNLNGDNAGSFNFINDATVTVLAGTLSMKNVAAAADAAITKNGGGTLVWGGNGTLNLRGPLTVNNGVVSCMTANTQDYQSIGTGLLFLGDTTPSNSNPAVINFVNSNSDMNPITVRAGSSGTIAITNDNGNHNFSGPLTLNNNLTLSHIVNAGTLSYYGAITGTGGLNIGNTGSITVSSVSKPLANVGSVALYGVNTHSGDTVVNSGTLTLGNLNVLQNSTLDTGTSGSQAVTFAITGSNTYNLGGLKGADDLAIGANTIGVGANGANTTYSGGISGTGSPVTSLIKTGAGTLTLSGTNTYTGATNVNGGTLLIDGSNTGSGAVNVGGTGTLGGTGSIAGAVNVTGVLSPGASIETLASGALTLNNLSKFAYEVNSSVAATVGADLQKVTGDLALNGTVTLNLTDIASIKTAFTTGTIFSLINYTGVWNSGLFTYNAVPLGDDTQFSFGDNVWQIDYNAATGGANFSGEYAGDTDSFVNITAISGTVATAYQTWIRSFVPAIPVADQDPGDDPDNDGATNLDEFAFGGIPNDASKKGLVFGLKADSTDPGTANEMILTLAVRTGVAFSTPGSPAQSDATVDGLNYAIQGSTDLTHWTGVVTPVATINPGLPTLPANYQYLSFSLNGSDGLPGKGFLRAQVTMP